jgi:hypothetical protein
VGIRVAVIDDNPHLSWAGRTYPANATFEQFVAALLDTPGSPVVSIVSCVPLRAADAEPVTRPLDPRIEVAGTAPFDGIEGYLRHLPSIQRANRPILRRAIRDADLAWIRVPGSNAAAAAALAGIAGRPRFAWVAGSARQVAAARFEGPRRLAGAAIGAGYDVVGRAAGLGGDHVVVGRDLVRPDGTPGEGLVASLVESNELVDPAMRPAIRGVDGLRLAWAGRLVEGKGLEALVESLRHVPGARLALVGDGPARERLAALANEVGVGDRVDFVGHVADRPAYLGHLAACDLFVFPSPAEGFPKVILDAAAVGLPILAAASGTLDELIRAGVVAPVEPGRPASIAAAVHRLAAGPEAAGRLRAAGHDLATTHTRSAEAARLAARWQARWPELPWGTPDSR